MSKRLRYADAVRLLGGSSPVVHALDNLAGSALSIATAGTAEALSLFDAKAEMARLAQLAAGRIADAVRGYGRYDRNQRLQAAHGVLVVTAFFEAFDDIVTITDVPPPALSRGDQVTLAAGTAVAGDWLHRLLDADLPVPSPDRSYDGLLRDLTGWYAAAAGRFRWYLEGLAEWDRADENARLVVHDLIARRLPDLALSRYEQAHRTLTVDIPEFAVWVQRAEAQAVGRGLSGLEAALRRIAVGTDPDRVRAGLAAAYRADLDRPILGGGDAGGLTIPTLGDAYVDPRFRVREAEPDARPAEEEWWRDTGVRTDLAGFLTRFLIAPAAAGAPLLLLGHPGAGKSALTRILAARLPATDFLAVRVVLREVSAEADIQQQIEQALRIATGRTVEWPDLAGAGGALPVVLLDGFDELLQATGIHQSDYLERVAGFQRREAVQGRPVAVVVTSRTAVADRARLPAGGLVLRLEPLDGAQVERWLATWNASNAAVLAARGLRPLPAGVVNRFAELAGQPLLLLMLALYDGGDNALQRTDISFGTTQLYDRLLRDFAAREVRRLHRDRPDADLDDLVADELMRLSVVAFAMVNRSRLWVTGQELDADLAGLQISPRRAAHTESFHSPLTAGEELIGRFFFIQRAQAVRDGGQLQTYEFLHATFGEYLVARLVVQALREAVEREAVRSIRMRSAPADDDLLRTLLGYVPLTARHTILPFVTELLTAGDPAGIRSWLIDRLRTTLTDPDGTRPVYRPVHQPLDRLLALYTLNLTLLAVACGTGLRASEVFPDDDDPAGRLRGVAQIWRGAVNSGLWLDVADRLEPGRTWTGHRRDFVLSWPDVTSDIEPGPLWTLQKRRADVRDWITADFLVDEARSSMDLTNNMSDDMVRHAVEPLLTDMGRTVTSFLVHAPGDAESVARSLMEVWLASTRPVDPDELRTAYERALRAAERLVVDRESAMRLLLACLPRDADLLPRELVEMVVHENVRSLLPSQVPMAMECLARAGAAGEVVLLTWNRFQPDPAEPEHLARMFVALVRLGAHAEAATLSDLVDPPANPFRAAEVAAARRVLTGDVK